MGVITETGPDQYRRTGFAITLGMPRYSDAYACMYVRSPLTLRQD